MKAFGIVEHPADRTAARWVLDVVMTLAAFALGLPSLYAGDTHPGPVAVVALVVLVAPLLVRRIWPVPVLAAMAVTGAVVSAFRAGEIAGVALLVALYTVVSMVPRRTALLCAALLEGGGLLAALRLPGGDWLQTALLFTGMVGAATALGLYAATRRAYLLELRGRAERLEREKAQEGQLAAAAERARIAREMHDIVAHHLTVMVALSDGAIAASARSPERGVEAMREVAATGRRALADTRQLLGVLRSEGADDAARRPLPDLTELGQLIDRVRAAGLPTSYEVHGSTADLPVGVQLTAYRLVQEALTNTMKHGGPDARAAVRVRHVDAELCVEVDDDGAGAAAPVPAGPGGGLAGMRERIAAFGGELESGPRSAGGWRVAARLRLEGVPA